jgi:hypothetical protein
VTLGDDTATVNVSDSQGGTGGGATGGHAAQPVPAASTDPPLNPADCGLFQSGDQQHCECTAAGVGSLIADYGECETEPATPGKPQPPSQAAVLAAVREASATLKLPDGVPVVAPDPANNEWDMIPIGYPIWLTSTAPTSATATATQDGIAITITATRGSTKFLMGEPKVQKPSVTCTTMRQRKPKEYPANKKSPDCGYVYQHMGTYTIQATTTWSLAWSAAGYAGTLDTTRTTPATTPLVIGQLRAAIVSVGSGPK